MGKNKQSRLFSFVSNIFYGHISSKFNTGASKNFMDYAYIIFEKIAVNFEIVYMNYINIYQEIVKKEVNISEISSNDSVLIIGCGSIPATSILVSNNSNAKEIIAIDYDLQAVKKATRFADSSIFDKNLKFEHADGLEYPIEKFDVIFVLYGIRKQAEILKYISSKIKYNSRVIFRTTNDSLIKFLGGKDFIDEYFKIEKIIKSEKFSDTVSFLLKKK
jgi:threonine dehydrogenase-like Zn-dependent dehydrogenase